MIVPGKSSDDRWLWKRKFSILYEPFSIFMYLSAFIFETLIVTRFENETSHITPFSLIQLTKKATKGLPELHISWQKIEDGSKPHSYLNVPGFGIKSPSFMLPFPFLTFCWCLLAMKTLSQTLMWLFSSVCKTSVLRKYSLSQTTDDFFNSTCKSL